MQIENGDTIIAIDKETGEKIHLLVVEVRTKTGMLMLKKIDRLKTYRRSNKSVYRHRIEVTMNKLNRGNWRLKKLNF